MNKNAVIAIVLAIALGGTGFVVFKTLRQSMQPSNINSEQPSPTEEQFEQNTQVSVDVVESSSEANTIVLKVGSLESKYSNISYEVTYESNGIVKGVNSGSKPLDISNQAKWSRDIYLGTCSKNVCKPDVGVTKVTVSLEFTDNDGKKTQFSKDFPL
jgi:hypothetical protein